MGQEAVLYVHSATDDESGTHSRKRQEQAGREYAVKHGLEITRIWETKGLKPIENRCAIRDFVEYVKATPSVQALLFERPNRLSRRFRDWIDLHDFTRKNGRGIRFFGQDQSPESDAMMLEMSAALHRSVCESRRKARKARRSSTDDPRP